MNQRCRMLINITEKIRHACTQTKRNGKFNINYAKFGEFPLTPKQIHLIVVVRLSVTFRQFL